MELFKPDLGLFFWTVLAFAIFLFMMKKFAWKPLLSILSERERSIAEALSMAEKARKEFAELEIQHKKIMQEAREERLVLIQEARNERSQIIADAKEEAIKNANRILENARQDLKQEREVAFNELKSEIARFSVQIAEIILKQKLENDVAQQRLIDEYIKDIKIN
jgi:F-type H+-transporting ATPase subunit b